MMNEKSITNKEFLLMTPTEIIGDMVKYEDEYFIYYIKEYFITDLRKSAFVSIQKHDETIFSKFDFSANAIFDKKRNSFLKLRESSDFLYEEYLKNTNEHSMRILNNKKMQKASQRMKIDIVPEENIIYIRSEAGGGKTLYLFEKLAKASLYNQCYLISDEYDSEFIKNRFDLQFEKSEYNFLNINLISSEEFIALIPVFNNRKSDYSVFVDFCREKPNYTDLKESDNLINYFVCQQKSRQSL